MPLAMATGAPVLAVEIKESSCLLYGGATPDGRAWLAHFANTAERTGGRITLPPYVCAAEGFVAPPPFVEKRCIFDHHEECTVPLPGGFDVPPDHPAGLADSLSGWAATAGFPVTAKHIADAIGTHTDETAVYGLIDALGLAPLETVYPLFALDEADSNRRQRGDKA